VSLDPYRLQSRKILAAIKDSLPASLQRVEKAGIDEVFLDLSAHVHAELLKRFPELSSPAPYDDPTEKLPLPSISALDWQADALVDLEEEEEIADPDWDDVAILIGSEIVRDVRARIRNELGYTCSGGIASNKLLSKLGSAYKKPNRQTVIRNRAISSFVGGFKVTKMRNLGGKLGEQVVSAFQSEDVSQLLLVPLDQMKQKLGEDTGLWVYNTIRGIDTSEVNARTQIKSMLSAKSFRPTISTAEQAIKWLRIFAADIYARLVEEGILEHKRRPRTINLHHRHAGQTRSRQSPIPQGKSVDENGLFELAKDLLGQIIAEGQVWPCANLSLSVGGFEDGPRGNMGIGAFLVRGEEADMLHQAAPDSQHGATGSDRPAKKRPAEESIHRFLAKKPAAGEMTTGDRDNPFTHHNDLAIDGGDESDALDSTGRVHIKDMEVERSEQECDIGFEFGRLECSRCKATFGDPEELQAHCDWHMAKDLQDEERVKTTFAERPAPSRNSDPKGPRASSKRGRGGKLEPGQRKLNFG
jgi:DNA polymerase eta